MVLFDSILVHLEASFACDTISFEFISVSIPFEFDLEAEMLSFVFEFGFGCQGDSHWLLAVDRHWLAVTRSASKAAEIGSNGAWSLFCLGFVECLFRYTLNIHRKKELFSQRLLGHHRGCRRTTKTGSSWHTTHYASRLSNQPLQWSNLSNRPNAIDSLARSNT